ncbi:MAG: hypothetical protein AAGM22_25300 [Acidobacteriota bacterium]
MKFEKKNQGFIYRRGVGAALFVIPMAILSLGALFGAIAFVAGFPWVSVAVGVLFAALSLRVAFYFAGQEKAYISLDAGAGSVEAGVQRRGQTHGRWRQPSSAFRCVSILQREPGKLGSWTLVAVIDGGRGQPLVWDLLPWTSELPGTLRKMAAAFAEAGIPSVEAAELTGEPMRLIPVFDDPPAAGAPIPAPVGRVPAPRPRGWNRASTVLALLGLVMTLPGALIFAKLLVDFDLNLEPWLFTEARRGGDLIFTHSAAYLLAMTLMAAGLLVFALAALRAKDRGFRQVVLPAVLVSALMIFMLPNPSDRVLVTAEAISQDFSSGTVELRFEEVDRVVRWFEGRSVVWILHLDGERRRDLQLPDLWKLAEARLIEVLEERDIVFEDFGDREPFDLR